jgi:hypothetical protein
VLARSGELAGDTAGVVDVRPSFRPQRRRSAAGIVM